MDQETGIIQREFPNAVIYDLSQPDQVTVRLAPKSTWSSGLHWHETHTEYLKVIKGSIKVRLGDTEQIVTATHDNQPELKVERYVWHKWQRAEPDGGEVVVVERTDPADGEKAIFFWNLNGVILNAGRVLSTNVPGFSFFPASIKGLFIDFWITLNLFIIFHSLDNIPVILSTSKYWGGEKLRAKTGLSADWFVSHLLLLLASWIGRLLGLQAVKAEYTPPPNYERWQEDQRFDKLK